jgi:hypothetical protein
MKSSIAGRRLAGFHAFPAAVTQGFINGVLIVVVVGILLIDFAYDSPFEGVLRTGFSGRKSPFIGLARNIEVSGAELAVAAFGKYVDRLHRRLAQNTGSAAEIAGSAAGRIDLKHRVARRPTREQSGRASDADKADKAEGTIYKFTATGFFAHRFCGLRA